MQPSSGAATKDRRYAFAWYELAGLLSEVLDSIESLKADHDSIVAERDLLSEYIGNMMSKENSNTGSAAGNAR